MNGWGLSLRHRSLQSIAAQSLALRRQRSQREEIIAEHVSDFRARYGQLAKRRNTRPYPADWMSDAARFGIVAALHGAESKGSFWLARERAGSDATAMV